MSDTDEIARLSALWCEEKSKSMTFYAEIERLRADLAQRTAEVAKANAERDEAHSLIRKWKVNLVEVVDDGEIMYAMTNDSMCNMTDSDKRAFLAATAKERGGA
jgi:hypothetical protein